jgi:hypothetical protein
MTRSRVFIGIAAAIIIGGVVVGVQHFEDHTSTIHESVAGRFAEVTAQLDSDPGAVIDTLTVDGFIRRFDGVHDGALTGTIALHANDGSCWGVHVVVPGSWVATGEGTITHDDVQQLPADACN